jgi:hypothetical protein
VLSQKNCFNQDRQKGFSFMEQMFKFDKGVPAANQYKKAQKSLSFNKFSYASTSLRTVARPKAVRISK